MAQRVRRRDDPVRTQQLAIDELYVLKDIGDSDRYHTWSVDDIPDCCPHCDGRDLRKQNLFSRSYSDYILVNGSPHIITLIYGFYKYRCMNTECRHIFAPQIGFATVNDNVTHRLEKRIADMVISGTSYGNICSAFQDQLSRQAIGQIFNRWTHTRDDRRRMAYSPSVLGAFTGQTDKGEYVLIVSCGETIRILDIMYGIDTARIIEALHRFGSDALSCILTDCNPTVYAAAKEAYPGTPHVIPAEMWLKLVRDDFKAFAQEHLKWVSGNHKDSKLLEARPADEENTSPDLRRFFAARSQLRRPYNNYHDLRNLITDREFLWSIEELDAWPETVDADFRQALYATLIQYREYRQQIALHQEYREWIPHNLLSATDRLEDAIYHRRTFSEEALRAAVLYSSDADPERWEGVEIEEAITTLRKLQTGSRRKKHDYE